MNKGGKEYTIVWFIENYIYCSYLHSPVFHLDGLEGTDWNLIFNPTGVNNDYTGNVSLLLCRSDKCAGPEDVPLRFQLSFLAADGSAHYSTEYEHSFRKFDTFGAYKLMPTGELLGRRRAEYLPNDTLTVCCKMWTGEGDVLMAEKISARTRIITETNITCHNIEQFSTLEPNEQRTMEIRWQSKASIYPTDRRIFLSLYFTDEDKIIIDIRMNSYDFFHKVEVYLSFGGGRTIKCGMFHYIDNFCRRKFPLSLTRKDILNNKEKYLPLDKLSFLFQCTFASSHVSEAIEKIPHEYPLNAMNQIDSEHPSLSEDMKALYHEQCLTDVKLKTKTKSFPAHKNVLCARSPVFKAMMTSDMEEKDTGCIQVDDLEDDIVQQLLLFLYSDHLEPLQWTMATQLYYAADKYAIRKLQVLCSSFLIENLSTSNASELLNLADMHNDSNLKKFVECFILENEEQVYVSNGWEKLKETNPQLVIETMHLKYKKKLSLNDMNQKRKLTDNSGLPSAKKGF